MVKAAVKPRADIRFVLREEDQLPRELEDLDRDQLESLRVAIESTLAERRVEERELTTSGRDHGFSCEWWPPD